MTEHADLVRGLLDELRREGIDVRDGPVAGSYIVSSSNDRHFAYEPVLTVPEELFAEYVRSLTGKNGRSSEDALFLARMHVVETLTTDHGAGVNHVRSLLLSRDRSGVVELVVDAARPDLSRSHDPDLTWTAER